MSAVAAMLFVFVGLFFILISFVLEAASL